MNGRNYDKIHSKKDEVSPMLSRSGMNAMSKEIYTLKPEEIEIQLRRDNILNI